MTRAKDDEEARARAEEKAARLQVKQEEATAALADHKQREADVETNRLRLKSLREAAESAADKGQG